MSLIDKFSELVKDNKLPIRVTKASGFYDRIIDITYDTSTFEREVRVEFYTADDVLSGVEVKPEGTYTQLLRYFTLSSIEPENNEQKQETYCTHDYIDVGFHFSKFVCKKCDKERGY